MKWVAPVKSLYMLGGKGPQGTWGSLLLVLHVGQLHVLFFIRGGRWLQVAANHELVHQDASDGAQQRRHNGDPPPVTASPGEQTQVVRGLQQGREAGIRGLGGGGCTYVNTSEPQPAMAVKRRGPKSRAGLTA